MNSCTRRSSLAVKQSFGLGHIWFECLLSFKLGAHGLAQLAVPNDICWPGRGQAIGIDLACPCSIKSVLPRFSLLGHACDVASQALLSLFLRATLRKKRWKVGPGDEMRASISF